ncbi:MAG: PAS domain-containing sensor histidine kinase [Thermomicrobiales bacterium]
MPIDAALLIAACPDAILVLDAEGTCRDANPAATRLLGYTRAELLVLPVRELIAEPIDWIQAVYDQIQLAHAWRGEAHLRRKDGAIVVADTWSIRVEDGDRLRFVTFLRDITAERVAEAAHADIQQQLEQVLERMTDGFFVFDTAWRITAMNVAAERMSGHDRQDVLGNSLWDLYPDLLQGPLPALYAQVMASGQSLQTEFERPATQSHFEVQLYPSPAGLAVFFRDITERKRQHEALVQALDHTQAANQVTRRFLTMMSHELRTPLQAILGYAELVLATAPRDLQAETLEDIRTIHAAARRLVRLIAQMLDFSRLEAGQQEIQLEPVTLATIVEEVVQESAPQAAAKHLRVDIDIPDRLPRVLGDAMAIHQILLNLVSNAIKFTHAGGIAISARATADEVTIAVADTGIGMEPEVVDHIFEEFWQAESGMTRRFEGSGLGLAITRGLTDALGGQLTVESVPGDGSRFQLTLPRADASQALEAGAALAG